MLLIFSEDRSNLRMKTDTLYTSSIIKGVIHVKLVTHWLESAESEMHPEPKRLRRVLVPRVYAPRV